MTRELTAAIYADAEVGPSAAEVRAARRTTPTACRVARSTRCRRRARAGGAAWLHETAPEYIVAPEADGRTAVATGGVARLERAVGRGPHDRRAWTSCARGAAAAAMRRGAGRARRPARRGLGVTARWAICTWIADSRHALRRRSSRRATGGRSTGRARAR